MYPVATSITYSGKCGGAVDLIIDETWKGGLSSVAYGYHLLSLCISYLTQLRNAKSNLGSLSHHPSKKKAAQEEDQCIAVSFFRSMKTDNDLSGARSEV